MARDHGGLERARAPTCARFPGGRDRLGGELRDLLLQLTELLVKVTRSVEAPVRAGEGRVDRLLAEVHHGLVEPIDEVGQPLVRRVRGTSHYPLAVLGQI